jgi:hypothetical protein
MMRAAAGTAHDHRAQVSAVDKHWKIAVLAAIAVRDAAFHGSVRGVGSVQ